MTSVVPAVSAVEDHAARPATVEVAVARLVAQATLLRPRPARRAVMTTKAVWPTRPVAVHVHRNFPAELALRSAEPFLAWAGWAPLSATFGAYDDALAFADVRAADVHLVLLDWGRYADPPDPAWLGARLGVLRRATPAPILVTGPAGSTPADRAGHARVAAAAATVPGAVVCDLGAVGEQLGDAVTDERSAELTGTALSAEALLLIGQQLGLVGLPCALGSRVRAVVVDLDHTLIGGAVGELGAEGVEITADHVALQRALVDLHGRGVFLALLSRNEPADVERLFATRADMVLRPEHFSAMSVSWGDKGTGLRAAVARLRVGTDQVLVVDDNVGELAAIAASAPAAGLLHAADPASTAAALAMYPGLAGMPRSDADAVRVADLAANDVRDRLRAAATGDGYLASLDVRLTVSTGGSGAAGVAGAARVAELSAKTNQFNLALARLSEGEVVRRSYATVALSDRLAESGVVAAVTAELDGETLRVRDLCISCRALGRGVEDVIVRELVLALCAPTTARVTIDWQRGARNAPALAWLQNRSGRDLTAYAGSVDFGADDVRAWGAGAPVAIVRAEQR